MARHSLYEYKRDGILEAIKNLTHSHHKPSLREVAEAADISIATLHSYLKRMQAEGVVEWESRHHRSLKVIGSQSGSELGMSVPSNSQP